MKERSGWQRFLFGGVVFVVALCLLACVGCMLLGNALRETPPEREFAIEELFIDASAFPSGWKADPAGPQVDTGQAPLGGGPMSIQQRVLFFYAEGTVKGKSIGAYEQIYRVASIKIATKEFERQVTVWFPRGKYWTPWERPTEVIFESSIADQFHIACAYDTAPPVFIEECSFLGQYEEYLVWFSTDMSPDYMTYEDLEHVLQAIDERMAHYLGKEAE